MHLKIVFLVISVIFFQSIIASETREFIPRNADYPNQCYVRRYGVAMNYGVTHQVPGKCAKMVCNRKRELTITGCEVINDPYCRISPQPQNRGKPFPDCCPLYMCA